jgi:hypothetical protein
MEIRKLIRQEIENQQSRTHSAKQNYLGHDTFSAKINIRVEEDRLRNMLVAESIAEQLAVMSISSRNHHMFQDLKKLFPATYEFCKGKVTHQ